MNRWLFHLAHAGDVTFDDDDRYAPASLGVEGFVHASHHDALEASAALYFKGAEPRAWVIDPRRLDVPLQLDATPRGPMPHIYGAVPRDAMRELSLADALAHADVVTGGRVLFVAFDGMTWLDLVGVLDPVSRIASMGIDRSLVCEVARATAEPIALSWCGLALSAPALRPDLSGVDVLVVPGGYGTRALERDADVVGWLRLFPANRLVASVCTGALLVGAAGRLRGKRAVTHHSEMARLAEHGATATPGARVVDEGQLITAGGVTCALDLGLHLVERLAGARARSVVAAQMEMPGA
ncbi:MAG: DUF952 domain-containing protein [Myxococcales bacterium]|nr:DUF952 domain-containing protein [Myxococcales bacterium]